MVNKKHYKAQSGQELVEFALILPMLLLLLFGLIEVGLVVLTYNTVANTGREVARYGSIQPNYALIDQFWDDQVVGEERRWSIGLDPDRLHRERTLVDAGPLLSTISVSVTYDYSFMTGPLISLFIADPNIQLEATSTMYTERTPFP